MTKKYLTFEEERVEGRVTKAWRVDNLSGSTLGRVHFYPAWRRYVFEIWHHLVILDADCLREIADFLKEQTRAQRKDAEERRRAAKAS